MNVVTPRSMLYSLYGKAIRTSSTALRFRGVSMTEVCRRAVSTCSFSPNIGSTTSATVYGTATSANVGIELPA